MRRSARRASVLVVSQLPPPVHGSTMITRLLLETLQGLGTTVSFVDRRFSRSADAVGRPSLSKVLAVPDLLQRLIGAVVRRRPRAIVLFVTNRPGSFLVDVLLLVVLRAVRRPLLLYVHTIGFESLAARGAVWRRLVAFVLTSGTVVTLGPSLVADVAGFTTTDPIVIPNPTGAPPVERTTSDRDDRFHAVFLSNLLPEKGADAFLRTADELGAEGARVRFTLAGAGAPERLAELRQRAAASPADIDVVGAVDDAAKWSLLVDADALVFPSTYPYEAQPLTIVEAMAAGVPVVAYDIGGVRDLLTDGENGRLIPLGDEVALVDAVRGLATDADAAATMRAAALKRHARTHSIRRYGARWRELLPMDADAQHDDGFASTFPRFRQLVRADWRANPRDVKSRAVLVGFRAAQLAMGDPAHPRRAGMLMVAAYRLWTEFGIGLELRPKTRVGGGLTIYHGYSLVVNDHAVIGRRVVLRNGITVGQRTPGGPSPVIGDDVEIGAGAILLGDIRIGDGARIGAGAVVLKDVPDGAAAVGNPARVLPGAS